MLLKMLVDQKKQCQVLLDLFRITKRNSNFERIVFKKTQRELQRLDEMAKAAAIGQ